MGLLSRNLIPRLRSILWLMAASLLMGIAPAATAEPPPGLIAIVLSPQEAPATEVLAGFRETLKNHNPAVALETFTLPGEAPQQAWEVDKIRAKQPRLILVLGSQALAVVSREIRDIPIIFGLILGDDLVPRPDNTTGVVLDFPVAVQFEWLHRVLPQARTVGVIYNRQENGTRIATAVAAARDLGLKLLAREIATPQELPAALESLADSADAFWGLADRLVVTPQTARSLLLFSFRNRIPFIGLSTAWVKAGALFALDRDYVDIGRQCGELAVKILSGARVATLPLVGPRRITYALNQRTAEQMKVELPPALLQGAATLY